MLLNNNNYKLHFVKRLFCSIYQIRVINLAWLSELMVTVYLYKLIYHSAIDALKSLVFYLKYLITRGIYYFRSSRVRQKGGVEFCHSTPIPLSPRCGETYPSIAFTIGRCSTELPRPNKLLLYLGTIYARNRINIKYIH